MSQLGISVMIRRLLGTGEPAEAFASSVSKKIMGLELVDNELRFTFDDGTKIKLFDDGQSCCEHRYMRTDDNLDYFVGGQLIGAEVRDAPNEEDEYGDHEVQFLVVTTSKGAFTVANHNEHNGYYGGFSVTAAKIE